jgi:hypothetical protein
MVKGEVHGLMNDGLNTANELGGLLGLKTLLSIGFKLKKGILTSKDDYRTVLESWGIPKTKHAGAPW